MVEVDDNSDTYNFTYAASENQSTVYPGKYIIIMYRKSLHAPPFSFTN